LAVKGLSGLLCVNGGFGGGAEAHGKDFRVSLLAGFDVAHLRLAVGARPMERDAAVLNMGKVGENQVARLLGSALRCDLQPYTMERGPAFDVWRIYDLAADFRRDPGFEILLIVLCEESDGECKGHLGGSLDGF
jgi:hypothetical protein